MDVRKFVTNIAQRYVETHNVAHLVKVDEMLATSW